MVVRITCSLVLRDNNSTKSICDFWQPVAFPTFTLRDQKINVLTKANGWLRRNVGQYRCEIQVDLLDCLTMQMNLSNWSANPDLKIEMDISKKNYLLDTLDFVWASKFRWFSLSLSLIASLQLQFMFEYVKYIPGIIMICIFLCARYWSIFFFCLLSIPFFTLKYGHTVRRRGEEREKWNEKK